MFEMEEFDSALRSAIEAGGDRGVQFIRRSQSGRIIPCSPNKILVATTHTLRPFRRILPIGFNSDYKTRIGEVIQSIDSTVRSTCGFNGQKPKLIDLEAGLDLLSRIEPTLVFDDEGVSPFDWEAGRSALRHLAHQHPDEPQRGKVLLWAADGRDSARLAGEGSHAKYIETPDSEKTEGRITKQFAIDHPILFLLRQEGRKSKGWRDTPFYWPVIRAQRNTPTAIYTAESLA